MKYEEIDADDITDNDGYTPSGNNRPMPAKMCEHHKPKDLGYIAWHEWAADMNRKGLKQKRCPHCKLYFFPEEMNDINL